MAKQLPLWRFCSILATLIIISYFFTHPARPAREGPAVIVVPSGPANTEAIPCQPLP